MSRIVIFAKAPVPGRCKTRLAAGLGARRAAAVYRSLLARTVAEAVTANAAPVEIWCHPDTRHPFFRALRRDYGVALRRQPRGDLGRRMHEAFRAVLSGARGVVMIGGDCPVLSADHLREALAALAGGADAVFGPAADGGYVLVGLREPHAGLFRGVSWGGPRVMAQTRRQVARLGLRAVYLPVLWDVDTMTDFRRMKKIDRGKRSWNC